MKSACLSVRALRTVAVAAALASSPASAFSFLCNGIDASGQVSNDGCGTCNGNTAARWEELQVDFKFDDATRPPEETLQEWQSHQTATVAGWMNVQGHSLTIRDAGAAQRPVFGEDNGENSVFWIISQTEWNRQQTRFSNINTTLGVTLAPYICGSPRRGGLTDADIVMNGTGVFNWNQTSVVSTMAHEMGHALGLGHPCVSCADTAENGIGPALMSATAGFNESDIPLFDDQQGIRALYPGTPGGIGTACTSDAQCDNNICTSVAIGGVSRSFCTQTCGTCPDGMICTTVPGDGAVCVFNNAGIADPGEACGPPGCVAECNGFDIRPGCNVCLPVDNAGNSQCFKGCTPSTGAGCAAGEGCSAFQDDTTTAENESLIGVCAPAGTRLRGQACDDANGCVDGVTCITDGNGNNGVCLGLCNASGSGCLNTENCLFVLSSTTQGVCFSAGPGGEGDSCTDFDNCARGLLCLGGECAQRCDHGFSCGLAGQNCTAVSGGNGMSVCSPVGGGEGEGEGNPGPGPVDADCDPLRGNFDCAAGTTCSDDGRCVIGGEGPQGTFALCDADADCAGGICLDGVCSRPCDVADGCPDGYDCTDTDVIPGGICRPSACRNNEDICTDDFRCASTSTGRSACVRGDAAGVTGIDCACDTTSSSGGAGWGLAALALVGESWRRRRLAA